MSSSPQWIPREAAAIRDRLARVQFGMEVKDAAGARIGRVAYVEIGDPGAVEPGGFDNLPGEEIAKSLGAHPEPHVSPELVARLLLIGYIKVEDKRRFRPDHHYYAMADEIVSVDDGTVRLGKLRDELIKSAN
jgi:hypothetical protein